MDSSAFVDVAPSGGDLSKLLYSPVTKAKQHIAAGASINAALDAGQRHLDRIVKAVISDTARQAASVNIAVRPGVGYVRMVHAPTCADCLILAGRFYPWNAGFRRHPGCDCVHVPVAGDEMRKQALDGFISDPYEAFKSMSRQEQDELFGTGNARAIRDGADIFQVVNSKRGRKKAFTLDGARKGYASKLLKPRQRRLTPDYIYKLSGSRETALRMLTDMGYIPPGGQTPTGGLVGQRVGFGEYGRGGRHAGAREAVLKAFATGKREGSKFTMTAAERRVHDAVENMRFVERGISPNSSYASELRGGPRIGSTPRPPTPKEAAMAELRYQAAIETGGDAIAMRQYIRRNRHLADV